MLEKYGIKLVIEVFRLNILKCNYQLTNKNKYFSGNQGNNWLKSNINIYGRIQTLFIEGRRGPDYEGDIAVDDLGLSSGICIGMKHTVTKPL